MSASTGDKARYNRQRRKKLVRRVNARKLQATLGASSKAEPESARQRDRRPAAAIDR